MIKVFWVLVVLAVIYIDICSFVGMRRMGDKHRKTHWSDKLIAPGLAAAFFLALGTVRVCNKIADLWRRGMVIGSSIRRKEK